MDIIQNTFNPTLLLVWLIFDSVRRTLQVGIQNMMGMVKSPADIIIYIFWPQNHLSGVQNSFLYVCTVVCAIQFCVAVHPFKQKRTLCKLLYRKKISCPSSQWLYDTTVHHDTLQLNETNVNFKIIHNPSSIDVNNDIMCSFYLIL